VGSLEDADGSTNVGREGVQGLFNDQLHADGRGQVNNDVAPTNRFIDGKLIEDRCLHKMKPIVALIIREIRLSSSAQ
jgi:hypothetical protein